jgi:hypothetical protein
MPAPGGGAVASEDLAPEPQAVQSRVNAMVRRNRIMAERYAVSVRTEPCCIGFGLSRP